jgi:hypothetical protein
MPTVPQPDKRQLRRCVLWRRIAVLSRAERPALAPLFAPARRTYDATSDARARPYFSKPGAGVAGHEAAQIIDLTARLHFFGKNRGAGVDGLFGYL